MIAVFVSGHRYGYNRDRSNYYEGHKRTKQNLMDFPYAHPENQFCFGYVVTSTIILLSVAAVSVVA